MSFQMQVVDIFHLSDGRTVFVGEIIEGPSHLGRMQCQLSVDDKEKYRFDIEGEMHFTPKTTSQRAISTMADIPVSSDDARAKHVVLEFADGVGSAD
ncbi:MAG TPA: hypothetical protein VNQ76_13640 [Planctomicrobium sp.]|nr:hypothetical protein [Planctomicrobium sp.]